MTATEAYEPILLPVMTAAVAAGRQIEYLLESKVSLKTTSLMVLDEIGRQPGINGMSLVALLHLSHVTINGVLGRLEAQGLIERTSIAGGGGRQCYLTPAGLHMADRARELLGPLQAAIRDVLPEREPSVAEVLWGMES